MINRTVPRQCRTGQAVNRDSRSLEPSSWNRTEPDMNTHPTTDAPALLRYNSRVLGQALALAAQHGPAGRPAYAGPVGSHLRHVIEHYDAVCFPATAGVVDYDSRPRSPELEASPRLASARLQALRVRLHGWQAALDEPVQLLGRAGLAGELRFALSSTWGRELVFVASHAVHHYALLLAHCRQHGLAVDADFGRAPATVAHDRGTAPASPLQPVPNPSKESTCSTI